MKISQALIDELVAHAREDLPNECCGMIGGRDDEVTKIVRVENAAASPLRYEMDPQGQFDALKEIEGAGEDLVGIYHSHTRSAAYPSQTDVNEAVMWPEQVYAIVWTKKLLHEEGVFAGVSAGAIAYIANRIAGELDSGNVVFLIPDDGWKYLSSGVYTKPIEKIENLDSTVWW